MTNEKQLIDAGRFKRILQNFEGKLLECGKTEGAEAVKTIIKGLKTEPTVDAVEVVHGRWVVENGNVVCSVCHTGKPTMDGYEMLICDGEEWISMERTNFCPNCGADMR